MSLYLNISKLCSKGKHVVVTDDEKFIVVSPFKDSVGDWRESLYTVKISEIMN